MASSGLNEWTGSTEVYSEDQIEAVLHAIGIEVQQETAHDFLSYCPYHGNRDTPAFATSRVHGASVCFNPACGATASLEKLVRDMKGLNIFQTRRLIRKMQGNVSYMEAFEKATKVEDPFKPFDQERLDRAYERFWQTPAAIDYMHGRNFNDETLEYFRVGYGPEIKSDPAKGVKWKPASVLVPMYDPKGGPVGYIGRSIEGKYFNNSPKLPKSHTIWNLHNAKRYESIILTEASFDAMRIHQAGYPNVGALLGGSISAEQIDLIKRHFTKVIIFTDDDRDNPVVHVKCAKCQKDGFLKCQGHLPGRDLGFQIADSLPRLRISWATYDDENIYAPGALEGYRKRRAKDASDMTDDEIRQCLRNAISDFEYRDWVA